MTGLPPLVTVAVKVTDVFWQAGVSDEVTVDVVALLVLPIAKSPNCAEVNPDTFVVVEVNVPIVGAVQAELAYLFTIKVEVLAPASRSPGFIKVNVGL